MTALEVIGAAGIWGALIAAGIFLGLVATSLAMCMLDRWRIHRAFWSFRQWKWLSEDDLNSYLRDQAASWWHERRSDRSWCRERDYEAGMRAAAKHLLRDHLAIVKSRKKA
jgi:hypothetical protein